MCPLIPICAAIHDMLEIPSTTHHTLKKHFFCEERFISISLHLVLCKHFSKCDKKKVLFGLSLSTCYFLVVFIDTSCKKIEAMFFSLEFLLCEYFFMQSTTVGVATTTKVREFNEGVVRDVSEGNEDK